MNDDFITMALQDDRYLKAVRLINQFETEIRRELERIGDQIVAENPKLFVDGVEADWNHRRSSGTILAFARVDYVMDRRRNAEEDAPNLKLNISFRWLEPEELGHHDRDGALTVTSYKIKRVSDEDYRQVKERTKEEDWPVYCAKDHFNNSPGIFYVPAETAQGIEDAHEVLREHFSEYGDMFGVESA